MREATTGGVNETVARAIAEAVLTWMGDTQPHSTFRDSARRLARRVIVHLEQHGYTPEELCVMPNGLDAIQPAVIAVSMMPDRAPARLYSEVEVAALPHVKDLSALSHRVHTLPWKWTTLVTIGLIREAVLTVRDGHTVVASWGIKS